MSRADTEVELVASDPAWPRRFAATAAELRAVWPDARVEHVGSTSVPGLSSKDTVDVAVGVPSVEGALDDRTLAALGERGFEHRAASFADDPHHAFLHRIVGDRRTDHVHVVTLDGTAWTGYLLFRDFLRADPDAARRYEAAKRELADRYAAQRDEYVTRKEPVVEALMQEALAWRSAGGGGS